MNNKPSSLFVKIFLRSLIFFNLCIVAKTTLAFSSTQEVFITDEPLPKLVSKLESLGRSPKEINAYLKKVMVTPDIAKDKFGITWIDNDLQQDYLHDQLKAIHRQLKGWGSITWPVVYPAVAICFTSEKVGYGLFALENIQRGTVIAEYTGKHIKEKGIAPPDSYDTMAYVEGENSYEKVAALHEGNAARFAQHLLTNDDLKLYKYKFSSAKVANSIALANSGLVLLADKKERHVVLMATKDIKKYEQIGYSYDARYGYEGTEWPEEPCLFDKDGNIIAPNQYQILLKGVMINDPKLVKRSLIPPTTEKELKSIAKKYSFLNGYIKIGTVDGKGQFFVKQKDWDDQLTTPKNRLTVNGTFITTADMLANTIGRRWDTDNIIEEMLGGKDPVKDTKEKEEDQERSKEGSFLLDLLQTLLSDKKTTADDEDTQEENKLFGNDEKDEL